jgi:sigma-B regulation protein RsbU (phosphoserine phosphatase)
MGGLLLGAFKDVVYQEETIQLEDGDVLVVFSDGVTEAMNQEGLFGEERLRRASQHREAAATELLDCLLERSGSRLVSQSYDITAMVLRYGPHP